MKFAMTDGPPEHGTRPDPVGVRSGEPVDGSMASARPGAGEGSSRAAAPLVVSLPSSPGRVRIPRSRGLPIARLDATLDQAWDHRLTLVIAPAGAGKTTLLGRFAQRRARSRGVVPRRRLGSGPGADAAAPGAGAPCRGPRVTWRLGDGRGRRDGARGAAPRRHAPGHRRPAHPGVDGRGAKPGAVHRARAPRRSPSWQPAGSGRT